MNRGFGWIALAVMVVTGALAAGERARRRLRLLAERSRLLLEIPKKPRWRSRSR